jgi:uncharacterized integral membrane protein (TIGR00697 family)
MTGAITIFPITYILSDLFSEVYGYAWSRKTCYMAFLMNLLMVGAFQLAIILPPASFWQGQEAFKITLGSTPRILFASLIAYVAGDFANDKVFAKMKAKHETTLKGFGARAILSSLVGEVCDSCIFIPLAFAGTMPLKALIIMGITQTTLKVTYEILILPLTKLCTRKVLEYEREN